MFSLVMYILGILYCIALALNCILEAKINDNAEQITWCPLHARSSFQR